MIIMNKLINIKVLLIIAFLFFSINAKSFPPAPDHLFIGMVKDEFGNPLAGKNVVVYLEADSRLIAKSRVYQRTLAGINYILSVPLDAGLTGDLYKAKAMHAEMPFVIRVKVGKQSYLPIEMVGDLSKMGEPSGQTHLNLTLGEDKDEDGLPDAWEKAQGFGDIRPEEDSDGDGMSNLDEYISGNYAYDKKDGLRLKIIGEHQGNSILEFMAIRGRTYKVFRSSDLKNWGKVDFIVDDEGKYQGEYYSSEVQKIKIEVQKASKPAESHFFKLMVD